MKKTDVYKGPRRKMEDETKRHERPGNQSEKRTERQVGMVIVLSVT